MPTVSLECKARVSDLLDDNKDLSALISVKTRFLGFYFYASAVGFSHPSLQQAAKIAASAIAREQVNSTRELQVELTELFTQSLMAWATKEENRNFFSNLITNTYNRLFFHLEKAVSGFVSTIHDEAGNINKELNCDNPGTLQRFAGILKKYEDKLRLLSVPNLHGDTFAQDRKNLQSINVLGVISCIAILTCLSAIDVEISAQVLILVMFFSMGIPFTLQVYKQASGALNEIWKDTIRIEILTEVKNPPAQKPKASHTAIAEMLPALKAVAPPSQSLTRSFKFVVRPATEEDKSIGRVINKPSDKIGRIPRGRDRVNESSFEQKHNDGQEEKTTSEPIPAPGVFGSQFANLEQNCIVKLNSRQFGENAKYYGIWNKPQIERSGLPANDNRYSGLFDVFSRGKIVGDVGTGIKWCQSIGFFEVKRGRTAARVVGENEYQNTHGTAIEFTTFKPNGFH